MMSLWSCRKVKSMKISLKLFYNSISLALPPAAILGSKIDVFASKKKEGKKRRTESLLLQRQRLNTQITHAYWLSICPGLPLEKQIGESFLQTFWLQLYRSGKLWLHRLADCWRKDFFKDVFVIKDILDSKMLSHAGRQISGCLNIHILFLIKCFSSILFIHETAKLLWACSVTFSDSISIFGQRKKEK